MTAESAKARNPVRNPIRGTDGRLEQGSAGDLMRIWNRHKVSAKEMGRGMMNVRGQFTPPPQSVASTPRMPTTAAQEAPGSSLCQGAEAAAPVTG